MNEITQIPRNPQCNNRLREEWRLLAEEHVRLDDNYQRLKEGLDIFYNELVDQLIESGGMQRIDATRAAKISDEYKNYMRKKHDARRRAKDAEIAAKNADRLYWDNNNREANERTERRLAR